MQSPKKRQGVKLSTKQVNSSALKEGLELEWNDLNVILAIGRTGSLSGAARTLGQNHSTIFRRINNIESSTQVRFFERLPNGYVPTEAGTTAIKYAERIENEVHALSREVLGQDLRLQGKIRISAPEAFTTRISPKLFAEFCRRHPQVTIEVAGSHAAADLTRREADIVIRATAKPPDTSLGRKVCDFRFGLYATPAYLERHRETPLAELDWCLIQGTGDWLVPHVWKKKEHCERRTMFSCSTTLAVINAAAEGMGITLMPCYVADVDNRLVRIELLEQHTLELWVLTHPDLRHTARVKALMSFMHEALTKDAELFEGNCY